MLWIQKAKESLAKAAEELLASRSSNVVIDLIGYEVHQDLDSQFGRGDATTWLKLYQKMMWIFKGVNTISSSAAMVPGKVWDSSEDGKIVEVKDHFVNRLFKLPNNLLTRYELFSRTMAYLELTGNAYWFLQRHKITKEVMKIHVVRPDRVEAQGPERLKADKKTNDNDVIFIRKRSNGELEDWEMRDVVHFTYFNPLSDFQGWPPIGTLQDTGLLDLYLLEFGKSYFENAAKPSMVFTAKNRISADSVERFMAMMRRMHKGYRNFHRIMLLEEDIQPTELVTKQPTDSDYVASTQHSQEKLLTALGCYHLVALLQNAQGNVIKDALRLFYDLTLDTRLTNMEETITKELLWREDARVNGEDNVNLDINFKFDRRMVSGFRDALMDESIADFRIIQSGRKTVNEIRRIRGDDGDLEWGDLPPPAIMAAIQSQEEAEAMGGMDEPIGGSRGRMMPNEERAGIDDSARGKTPRSNPAGDNNDTLKSVMHSPEFLSMVSDKVASLLVEKMEDKK